MSGAGVLLFQRGQVGQNIKATGNGAQCKSADFSIWGYKEESSKTDFREILILFSLKFDSLTLKTHFIS